MHAALCTAAEVQVVCGCDNLFTIPAMNFKRCNNSLGWGVKEIESDLIL
jgi:hypothetical protein